MVISDQLLELGFLTEEEKEKLQKVLAADENLQKTQYNHFMLVLPPHFFIKLLFTLPWCECFRPNSSSLKEFYTWHTF